MNQITQYEPVTIAGVSIRHDAEGRYCLNDLHKAAGNENRHQPAFFLKRPETIELVSALSNSSTQKSCDPVATKSGKYGGTYVVKELVYAYANWISPVFYLQTIRTFDAVVTGNFDALPPAMAERIGQMIESVITSQIVMNRLGGMVKSIFNKNANDILVANLPGLVHGELAKHQMLLRKGETPGQVWNRWKLETKGMRGGANWLGNLLASKGCQMDGKGEAGGKPVRLFDPDKCDAVKALIMEEVEAYINKRLKRGVQGNLFVLVPTAAASANA
jgi:hypothetical protein